MNIPDKAVEAVLSQDQSWPEEYSGPAQRRLRAKVRLDLETAAPFIAAQAWQDGYDTGTREPGWDGYNDEPWDDTGDRRTRNPYNGKYPR